jgi:hypothetical protein
MTMAKMGASMRLEEEQKIEPVKVVVVNRTELVGRTTSLFSSVEARMGYNRP